MSFQTPLLNWFAVSQRPLPWRKHYRPYEVWVSEVMLQQTQVETMLPYYRRWIKTLPTIRALAKAPVGQVLKLWEGLGYYSRARNLHESAIRITEQYNGRFPDHYETILSLKGIGRYSAGAIASIAFNQPRPIVDGNVLRVLSRVYAIGRPIDVPKNHEIFWRLQEKLIPQNLARQFNQALMELGALICLTQNPSCPLCPIRPYCKAARRGDPENYPVKIKRKKTVRVIASAAILEHKGRYLIRRRPLGAVMGGLWEFPEWKLGQNKELDAHQIQNLTRRRLKREFGIHLGRSRRLEPIKRNYTHHLEILYPFQIAVKTARPDVLPGSGAARWPHAWITLKDFGRYPFSSAHAKMAARLG